jgi:hypothetical protein
MGNYISQDELEDIEESLEGSCQKLRVYINNLWNYIYNKDEKKHMQ